MQLVSEKRIYLEIATRNLNRIFTLPKRNFFRDTFWNHVKVILSKECSVTAVNYYCTDIKVCKVLCNIYLTGFVETYPRAHNTQLKASAHGPPPHPGALDTHSPCTHRHSALWLSYRSAIAWPSIMQDSRQRKSASQAMGLI